MNRERKRSDGAVCASTLRPTAPAAVASNGPLSVPRAKAGKPDGRVAVAFKQHRDSIGWYARWRGWHHMGVWNYLWSIDPHDGTYSHAAYGTIAQATGIDLRSVKRVVGQLVQAGLLQRGRTGSKASRTANEYRIPNPMPQAPLQPPG